MRAVKLWLLLLSTYAFARLACASVFRERLSPTPEGWALLAIVPLLETAALLLAVFTVRRLFRGGS